MPQRILLLTYAFPPMAYADAFASAKRMGSVPGFEVDVVCAEPPPGWKTEDHSLDDYVAERFGRTTRVRRSRVWDLIRLGRFARVILPPDPFRTLNGPARRAAAQALRERPYSALVTWSQMHSVQLVGLSLKRQIGIPWIAYLGDPWASNPFLPPHRLESRINRWLERRVLAGADRLLFPSRGIADLTLASHPKVLRSKVDVIPHIYEPRLFPPKRRRPERGDPLVFRYLGAFYFPRTLRPIVDALLRIGATEPDLLRRIRVEIVGHVEAGMLESTDAATLPPGILEIRPRVDYVQSLRLMEEADGLLVVDAPAASSPFLPSKLVDYVGAGRPIAALSPEGPSADLTRRLGGPVADPTDPDACAEAIRRLVQLASANDGSHFGPADVRNAYDIDTVSTEMARVVRDLLAGEASKTPAERQMA